MNDQRAETCAGALAAAARTWPDQQAILANGASRTYRELQDDVGRVAANLARLGIRRGSHVAICMGNTLEWATIFLAAASLGAVTVPVNTRFKEEELLYTLKNSDSQMLIVSDRLLKIDFIAMLRTICPAIDARLPDGNLPRLETIVVFGDDVPAGALPGAELYRDASPDAALGSDVEPDDAMLMQYTSGTTSFAKGVLLSHRSMMRDAYEVSRRLGLRPGDRYLSARPLFHIAGTVVSLLAAIEAGACYITLLTFDAERILELLENERCTHTSGNDTMFLMLMNHPTFAARRLAVRGGLVAATEAVMRQIHDRMGMTEICCGYGMSEATGNVAHSPWDDDLEKRLKGFSLPLPGITIGIVDPATGAPLPAGKAGEIRIRGWSVMKGYYNLPDQTRAAFDDDGWLRSGDLGLLDEGGRLLFIGRLKETIRVGGENVAPTEIEDILHRHPAVKQAQVIGVPDPRLVEVVAAYVILQDGAHATGEEIIDWMKSRCASFKVPRYVRMVGSFDAIGMTASSKVQKSKLREYALDDLKLR